jgi:hypothetical protein
VTTTDDDESPVVRGISVSYLPQPEPNWLWNLSFVVMHEQTLNDGTVESVYTKEVIDFIQQSFRNGDPVTFVDIDGRPWEVNGQPGVLIQDMTFVYHVPGYGTDPPEGRFNLTLLEVAESY